MARLHSGILEYLEEDDNNKKFSNLTKATYSIYNKSGIYIFHLRTYGTSSSKLGQASQNIELDKQTALELIELLENFVESY